MPESVSGKLFFDGSQFYLADTGKAWRREGGESWMELPFADSRLSPYAVARSDAGTYVAITRDGDNFYRSPDGQEWQDADGEAGNDLLRVVFGFGLASDLCPAD